MNTETHDGKPVDLDRLVRLHELQKDAARAVREALVDIYPVGTVVEATPRNPKHARFRGIVVGHYPAEMAHGFSHGGLSVKNSKTGKIREVLPISESEDVRIVSLPNATIEARRDAVASDECSPSPELP